MLHLLKGIDGCVPGKSSVPPTKCSATYIATSLDVLFVDGAECYSHTLKPPVPTCIVVVREFHLDYEVRSGLDVRDVGAHRYAEDPSTHILMAGIAEGAGPVYVWVNPKYDPMGVLSEPEAIHLLHELHKEDVLVYAHNAEFERAVSFNRLLLDVGAFPPRQFQWRCTAAMCRKAALPAKLETAAQVLCLSEQKDSAGSKLIKLFCDPTKTGDYTDPSNRWTEFTQFVEYCRQDVHTERALKARLSDFRLKNQSLATFQMDTILNDRGIPVNVEALKKSQRIVDEVHADLGATFTAITGLSPTQRGAFQLWLMERGVYMTNMSMDSLKAAIDTQTDPAVVEPLQLYSELNYAATKKLQAMLDCVCSDGRVRGTLLYHGARTGRWAGMRIQPHNFKRPTIKNTHLAYQLICDGADRETLDLLYGNALEVIASCIRHYIQRPDGKMLDADYNAIEARIVCWLADQLDVLEDFANDVDIYKEMAGEIYSKPPDSIVNPSYERTVGKHTILGCGFGMSWRKFKETCAKFKVVVSDTLSQRAVQAYRTKCHLVEQLWYITERAAINAVNNPGSIYKAGSKLKFAVVESQGVPYLSMVLPSGRSIVYPWPKLEYDPKFEKHGVTFYGQLEGKAMWGRLRTYGAKLVENATQAVAADVMAIGTCEAERQRYTPFALIHDQALAEHNETLTPEGFCKALTTMPVWADGLPVKAEGRVVPFYTKS